MPEPVDPNAPADPNAGMPLAPSAAAAAQAPSLGAHAAPLPAGRGPRPGFRAGAGVLFRAIGFLIHRPKTWLYCWVPVLIALFLASIAVWVAIAVVQPWVLAALPTAESSLGEVGLGFLAWVAAILSGLVGVLLALALTPPLSGPALEKLVAVREVDLAIPARADSSFLYEMWCGLKAQAFAALFAVPILSLLWVLELFLPVAAVVTIPLRFLVTAVSLAWNLFDYPLTLRGLGMRDRFAIINHYGMAVLGFGVMFALLFWIPCFGILMLPVGVVASTELVWRLLRHDPTLLPNLPR